MIRACIFGFILTTAAVAAAVVVTTQHNNLSRTGTNLEETILNTSNVNTASFGKLFSRTVDGQIYAQPLYVPALAIPSQGIHDVIYICTQHNSVYAFDADLPTASTPLWHVNLGPSLPSSVIGVTRDILPEIGITGTPVIDLSSSTLYVVAETYESGQPLFRLHALDITTGAERPNSPVLIQGSVPGGGLSSVNGIVPFDASMQWQRPGLLLLNGTIYIGFGSHQLNPHHGWILGYNAATLQQTAIFCTSPDADSSGVWQGGVGLAADSSGAIYAQTGQGPLDAHTGGRDYGDSLLKISTAGGLNVIDYFSPSNQAALFASDIDLGSSGPVLIPGTSLGVTGGKDGKLFLFSTSNLGQFHTTDQVVQSWQATFSLLTTGAGGIFGGTVFYDSKLYLWGRRDALKVFAFNGAQFNTTPISQSTFTIPDGYSNEPAMSLSANGTTPGTAILWAAYSATGPATGGPFPGILRAFDASDVTRELWNSDQVRSRDYSGSWAKWSPPTIANGKVYLSTFDNVLNVYGLLASGGGGMLSGVGNSSAAAADLTSEGSSDWVHWGDSSLNRKAGAATQISTYSVAGSGTVFTYTNDPRPLSWTDGTPTASSTNNKRGVFISGQQNGFYFTTPADTTTRTLTVHLGGWNSGGRLTARLSDGSAPDFADVTGTAAGQYDRNYTLTYAAGLSGQFLTITWIMVSGTGNVTLDGAALSTGAVAPDFALSANPPSRQAAAGGSASFTVNVSATGGFTGSVGFTVSGLPTGVTAAFSPATVAGSGSSNLNLSVARGTTPGNYPLTITGSSGALSHTASVTLGVTDFSITANPSSQSVVAGSSAGYSLTITALNGFSGSVGFTLSGLPTGVSANFNPATVPGAGSSTMTLATGISTVPGTYPLTITAASGSTTHTANVSLSVTAPAGGGSLIGFMATPAGTVQLTSEGTSDWAHWGMAKVTDFNHKAGVTQQISNYSTVGTGTVSRYGNNSVGFSWTDGTPTASVSGTTTGLYILGQGQGFRITAPADTAVKTLRVYVGAWRAQARILAHLSDGSSADYTDNSLTNNAGVTTLRVYTFTYSSASPGQTLAVTITQTNPTIPNTIGNVTLQAATLTGGSAAPDYAVTGAPASQTAAAGSSASYTVTVTALSGFTGTVGFSVSGLPAGASAGFSPAAITGSGSVTMAVDTAATTAPGSYPLTTTAASGSLSHTATVTLAVTGPPGSGALNGSVATPSETVQLTTEGTTDWAHWGLNAATDFDHKAAVTPQISNYTLVNGVAASRYTNNSVGFTWTDGSPAITASNSTTGVFISGQTRGFRITVPADTTARTLRVYVGAWRTQGRMLAQLSDGSAADYVDTSISNTASVTTVGVYTFVYRAGSSGQTLTVTFTQNTGALTSDDNENVTLQAATLQ